MVDDPTSELPEKLEGTLSASEKIKISSDRLNQTANNLNAAAQRTSQVAEHLANVMGSDSGQAKALQDINKETERTRAGLTAASKEGQGFFDSLKKQASKLGLGDIADKALSAASKVFSEAGKVLDLSKKDIKALADSGGAIAITAGYEKAIRGLKPLIDAQDAMIESKKAALQMGMSFGQSFEEASSGMTNFRKALSESQTSTQSLRKEVVEVQNSLKDAFSTNEMISNLDNLVGANKTFRGSLTLTNSALLAAKAMGMNATVTAKMLAEAHLYLGESAKTAPNIFAEIADAQKKSGLGYEKVASAVMDSAKHLKLWGGTVSSVTPIFKAFSASLSEGQKGLAPELLSQYISGIQGMSLANKAFIGINASGGAGGKSVIGAGLEQERLMGQGAEGMKQISQNLIDTIKNKFGGQLITLEDTANNPELENSYVMQRQYMKKIGINDAGTADKILAGLKEIDKGTAGDSAFNNLNKLITDGQKTSDQIANEQLQALVFLEATTNTHGTNMVAILKAQAKASNIPIEELKQNARNMAEGQYGALGWVRNAVTGLLEKSGSGNNSQQSEPQKDKKFKFKDLLGELIGPGKKSGIVTKEDAQKDLRVKGIYENQKSRIAEITGASLESADRILSMLKDKSTGVIKGTRGNLKELNMLISQKTPAEMAAAEKEKDADYMNQLRSRAKARFDESMRTPSERNESLREILNSGANVKQRKLPVEMAQAETAAVKSNRREAEIIEKRIKIKLDSDEKTITVKAELADDIDDRIDQGYRRNTLQGE